MSTATNRFLVLTGLTMVFSGLAVAFYFDLWGRPAPRAVIPATPPDFTNTATVRLSAADLFRTDGDTSGLACYTCHDANKQPILNLATNGNVIVSEPHKDIVMLHGRNNRNDHCFNCHDPKNLESLRTREGRTLKLTESSRLCGSCHGPTYRDWETGIHGRTAGFWDRKSGAITRSDCTSCHNPHSPAFPAVKPGPPPNQLHPERNVVVKRKNSH